MITVSSKVKEYLSAQGKMNILSTCSKDGNNNVAIFGSLGLKDDSTIMVALGDNRSYANLMENPDAALLVIVPGKTGLETEGCRLYLKLRSSEDSSDILTNIINAVRSRAGDAAADSLKHLLLFDIVASRPIVDIGQNI